MEGMKNIICIIWVLWVRKLEFVWWKIWWRWDPMHLKLLNQSMHEWSGGPIFFPSNIFKQHTSITLPYDFGVPYPATHHLVTCPFNSILLTQPIIKNMCYHCMELFIAMNALFQAFKTIVGLNGHVHLLVCYHHPQFLFKFCFQNDPTTQLAPQWFVGYLYVFRLLCYY